MVFPRQYRAVVHWIRGPSSVSESSQITLFSLLFELSSCARLTRAMLLVRDVARNGIPILFLKTYVFSFFRFSFRNTSNLSPFPFSATSQVMNNHTRNRQNLTGKLYFVCKHCWIYLRHVSTLHEPCRGCAMMESIGWEFWTPGRGRSAWWRHPCWMFIIIFSFNRFPLDHPTCDDFQKLAHPSQTLYRQSSRMVQLITSFQTKTSIFFLVSQWILAHFNFRQEWRSLELFCPRSFKGVTPLGRRKRPACN